MAWRGYPGVQAVAGIHSASMVEAVSSAVYLHFVVSAAHRVVALTKVRYFALTY